MSGSVEVLAANNRSSGCDAGVVLPLTPRSPDRVEDYIEELTKNGPVELRAYGHQVGGHSLLMKFGKAVCKPMIPRERFFYDSRTLELQRFTPIYYGVVSIKFHQTEDDGRVHLVAIPRSSHQNGMGHSGTTTTTTGAAEKEEEEEEERVGCDKEGGTRGEGGGRGGGRGSNDGIGTMVTWRNGTQTSMGEVERLSLSQPIVRLDFFKATGGCAQLTHEGEIVTSPSGVFSNPWSLACMENVQSTLSNYSPTKLEDMFQDYLVLEDLTCKFECPCILDLKMGTRQYGDDQSEEKKKKHTERCSLSTSSRLGVRLNGMQVYNAAKRSYLFKDKYYGRELSPDGFHGALRDFLHNGHSLRTDILPILIDQLRQLSETISKQDTFRFYSSSLLVMYDGGKLPEEVKPPVVDRDSESCLSHERGRVSDCGNATSSQTESNKEEKERREVPRGEKQLEGEEEEEEGGDGEGEKREGEHTSISKTNHHHHQRNHKQNGRHHPPPLLLPPPLKEARQLVDIRMIDFAHTTHSSCKQDTIKYTGPDEGYMLGLNTLITSFQSILEDGSN